MPISFGELVKRVQAFNPLEKTKDILLDNPEFIPDLIRTQLYEGQFGYGGKIGEYKDPFYADEKYDMNAAAGYGNVDLKYTGSFYEQIKSALSGNSIETESQDFKNAKLTKKYGDAIFKMNDESLSTLRMGLLKPGLVHAFSDQTGAQIG